MRIITVALLVVTLAGCVPPSGLAFECRQLGGCNVLSLLLFGPHLTH